MALVSNWRALALTEEVTADGPIARACDGFDYVLYRDPSGAVHALEDRCAHRRVPLSLGRIREDGSLQCGYHGWCYDGASGQCVAIAVLDADERVPGSYKVEAFATEERGGFVYVWTGGAAEATRDALPDLVPDAGGEGGASFLGVPHEQFIRTLLDAPHLVLALTGGNILAEPIGDPILADGMVRSEYAVVWPGEIRPRTQSPVDFPFILRVRALPVSGQAVVEIVALDDTPALTMVIASELVRPCVTAVRWRTWRSASDGADAFSLTLHETIDPRGLLELHFQPAGELWAGAAPAEVAAPAVLRQAGAN